MSMTTAPNTCHPDHNYEQCLDNGCPKCEMCGNHGFHVPVKDHQRLCPYKECMCDDCNLTERKRIMALRRLVEELGITGVNVSGGEQDITEMSSQSAEVIYDEASSSNQFWAKSGTFPTSPVINNSNTYSGSTLETPVARTAIVQQSLLSYLEMAPSHQPNWTPRPTTAAQHNFNYLSTAPYIQNPKHMKPPEWSAPALSYSWVNSMNEPIPLVKRNSAYSTMLTILLILISVLLFVLSFNFYLL